MSQLAVVLQAAQPDVLGPEHLPVAPAWWPPDRRPSEDEPEPRPYSDAERAAARRAWQLTEARRGPYDGTRYVLALPDGAQPPELMTPQPTAAGFVYRLDRDGSTDKQLIYRYSPADSYSHADTMRAVEAAFAQAYPEYVHAARAEHPQSHGITLERIS